MREFIGLLILIFLAWLTYDNSGCGHSNRSVETPTESVEESEVDSIPVDAAEVEAEETEEPVYTSSPVDEDEREKEVVYESESDYEDENRTLGSEYQSSTSADSIR